MRRHFIQGRTVLLAASLLFVLSACSGTDGANGANGANGTNGTNGTDGTNGVDLTASAQPESCVICHGTSGTDHQAIFNTYTDATKLAVTVDSVVSTPTAGNTYTSVMTITITGADGFPLTNPALLKQKTFKAQTYSAGTNTFDNVGNFSYAGGTLAATGTPGQYTVTKTGALFAPEDPANNAFVYGYVATGTPIITGVAHYNLFPDVSNFARVYAPAVAYTSSANLAGCEGCHGKPYRKHGYRMADAVTSPANQLPTFVACKTCHMDQTTGTDYYAFGVRVDDPATWANWFLAGEPDIGTGSPPLPAIPMYDYTASLMNDTHMSHAMEFEYPQSMANCATCHAGKLAAVITDANFTPETCKSCHPVTANTTTQARRAPALKTVATATAAGNLMHANTNFYTATSCNGCHNATGSGKAFSQIHGGYDPTIYAGPAGAKYSANIVATIDTATVSGNVLDVKFAVAETAGFGVNLTNMMPTLVISLYGYDTKDFLVSGHNRDDGVNRNLEFVVGGNVVHPRFTVVSAATAAEAASWEVKVDLSYWASKIADGSIKRAEIGLLPTVVVGGTTVALNAPSKTFDLVGNAFVTSAPIVDAAKCNKCHDALGTTFHSAQYGGNVTVCRLCHTGLNGGSHLEMESRSIDSYVHAIHTSQKFDISSSVNMLDPVSQAMYLQYIESNFPNFAGRLNCEACHVAGAYDVPDQSKSMPGVLSASSKYKVGDRAIGTVPSYVTGPASRACGGCHRAKMINEDDAGKLAAFNGHTDVNGYMLDNSVASANVLNNAIIKIMSMFK